MLILLQRDFKEISCKIMYVINKKKISKINKRMRFSMKSCLIKQIDGCLKGVLCLLFFLDIFMCKMEDVAAPAKPTFTNVMLMTHTYAERKMLTMNYSGI